MQIFFFFFFCQIAMFALILKNEELMKKKIESSQNIMTILKCNSNHFAISHYQQKKILALKIQIGRYFTYLYFHVIVKSSISSFVVTVLFVWLQSTLLRRNRLNHTWRNGQL